MTEIRRREHPAPAGTLAPRRRRRPGAREDARVSNGVANLDYPSWTLEELSAFARQIHLPGRSDATREELIDTLLGR